MFFKPEFWQKNELVTIASDCTVEGASGYVKTALDGIIRSRGAVGGDIKNISVQNELCSDFDIADKQEGYGIKTDNNSVVLYGNTQRALIYAAVTLLQMSNHEGIFTGTLYDEPDCAFRGYRCYLPGRNSFDDFKKMVDTIVYYKYNCLSLEIGGAMEYKRHPEINESWKAFAEDTHRYSGRTAEIQHGFGWSKNSIHTDNGEGDILTQDEVRGLIAYARERGLEVYPEVPTLSHSDYICLAHPELAERSEDPYPDTYCPNHPDTYKIVFDILEEIIDVFEPKVVNIGHDELYTVSICERCNKTPPHELYVKDIVTIYEWLKKRGIRTMMWGEKLLPVITKEGKHYGGAGGVCISSRTGKKFEDHPVLFYCQNLLPRDIIMLNWYYAFGIQYDYVYHVHGYNAVAYGNMSASSVEEWRKRRQLGMKGGSCSNWGSNKPIYMQRNNQYFNLVFGAYALWSKDYDSNIYAKICKKTFDECFHLKHGNLEEKPYITVYHTTDKKIPYKVFYDGIFIEHDIYHMGKYKLTYTDGSECEFEVNYGENISCDGYECEFDSIDNSGFNTVSLAEHPLMEVSYSTVPFKHGGKTYYKTAFLNPHPEKTVASFEYIPATDAKVEILKTEY